MKLEPLFDWLVFTLIKLAASSEKQNELINPDDAGGDIADDFENFYGNNKDKFVENELLNTNAINHLEELLTFFTERTSKDEYIDFWSDRDQLSQHPDWETVRQLSYHCLVAMERQKYRVELQTKTDTTGGTGLILSQTKFKLVKRK